MEAISYIFNLMSSQAMVTEPTSIRHYYTLKQLFNIKPHFITWSNIL